MRCRSAWLISKSSVRRLCTAIRRRIEDEGDWSYSSEWWDPESAGHTVLRVTSDNGNGVVSVVAHPSSRPKRDSWPETERWLEQRYAEVQPDDECSNRFRVLGYQWRSLRFNDDTRQSTVKVMAACQESQPGSVFYMQQPHCLAVPYVRSMVSVGVVTLASCNYDLMSVACGKRTMRVLCIGHGGGSLPLFLASKCPGAIIDIVEIDPLVISASVQAMGFPAFSVRSLSEERASPNLEIPDRIMWTGVHERLSLYQSDAEDFVLQTQNVYDLIFIDAYDGADIFPYKLWDPHSPFLKSLTKRLHPQHGTVVVNLHSDSDIAGSDGSIPYFFQRLLPVGRYVSIVGRAYKDVLLGSKKSGVAFVCAVPWLCNMSLVVSRGLRCGEREFRDRDRLLSTLLSKSVEVDRVLDMPFSCLEFTKSGFALID